MAKYVICPRCELNFILEGENYCDVCKAELKIGPQLQYADEEDRLEEKLCPKCKQIYIPIDEDMCEICREKSMYDIEPDESADIENDEKWRDYLDADEKEEISNSGEDEEEQISLSLIAQEEEAEFADEEEEDELYENNDDDDDDLYNYDISDIGDDIDEEEEVDDGDDF